MNHIDDEKLKELVGGAGTPGSSEQVIASLILDIVKDSYLLSKNPKDAKLKKALSEDLAELKALSKP